MQSILRMEKHADSGDAFTASVRVLFIRVPQHSRMENCESGGKYNLLLKSVMINNTSNYWSYSDSKVKVNLPDTFSFPPSNHLIRPRLRSQSWTVWKGLIQLSL